MRIFYAADTTPNANFTSNLWRNNLYLPLVDLGHDVVEFQFDFTDTFRNLNPANLEQKAFIDQNRPLLTEELLKQIRAAHAVKPVDLFFSYFYDACILPEAIEEIKGMGIKTVNWYCNGSYQLQLVSEISPHYDWCLVPEKFRVPDYLAMGAQPIYCQEAANPNVYKPYNLPVEYDVTFVGQAYGERPSFIKYLLDQGIDIRVWGYGWSRYTNQPQIPVSHNVNPIARPLHIGKRLLTPDGWLAVGRKVSKMFAAKAHNLAPVPAAKPGVQLPESIIGGLLSDAQMIEMYSRSKINLGFSSCGETHNSGQRIVQVRLRDFEVPMSGGFYVVEYMEELEEFFEIGKEIVCYTGPEDLAEKIKYYLIHDTEREAIRQAGYERCKTDHTWHKRFEASFKEMGLV